MRGGAAGMRLGMDSEGAERVAPFQLTTSRNIWNVTVTVPQMAAQSSLDPIYDPSVS